MKSNYIIQYNTPPPSPLLRPIARYETAPCLQLRMHTTDLVVVVVVVVLEQRTMNKGTHNVRAVSSVA